MLIKKIIYYYFFCMVLLNNHAFATLPESSDQINPRVATAKRKIIKIDTTPAGLRYFPMGTTGCPTVGNIRYVLIGVTRMPNVTYTTTNVSGEFDFNFSQAESPCVTWTYKYHYYDDGSWMWWVMTFGTAQIVCAPVYVVWN